MGKELILPGQNNVDVDIKRETVKPRDDLKAEKANFHLKTAGEAMCPPGCEYVGSFAGHMYKDLYDQKSFVTVTQSPIGRAHEVWCDVAWKEVKKALMIIFGREEPRRRKN